MNSENTKRENADNVLNWLKVDLCFDPRTTSKWTQQNLKGLFKSNTANALWQYMFQYVKSKEYTSKVILGLEFDDQMKYHESILSKKEALKKELKELTIENRQNNLLLKKLKSECQNNNFNLTQETCDIEDTDVRNMYSKVLSQRLDHFAQVILSYAKWFEELTTLYNKNKSLMPQSVNSKTVSDLSKTCQSIISLFDGSSHANRQDVGYKISLFNQQNSAEEIINALKEICRVETEKLQKTLRSIDVVGDKMKIECSSQNQNENIETLLENVDIEFVNSYASSLQNLQSVKDSFSSCDSCIDRILDMYKYVCGDTTATVDLAKSYIYATVQLEALETTLKTFQRAEMELREDINKRNKSANDLIKLKQELSDLKETLEHNQESIRTQAKHNSSVKSKLESKQQSINQFTTNEILDKHTFLAEQTKELNNLLNSRTIHLRQPGYINKMLFLSHSQDNKIDLNELTHNLCSENVTECTNESSQTTCNALKPPSCAFMDIIKAQSQLETMNGTASCSSDKVKNTSVDLKKLIVQSKAVHSEQRQNLLPVLQKGKEFINSANKKRKILKEEEDACFQQPAENIIAKYN